MKIAEECAKGAHYHCSENAQFAAKRIERLIVNYGPRAPGSEAEYAAQKFMAAELEPLTDSVETEQFTVHRQAFMGFIPFTVLVGSASALLFWRNLPLTGFVLALLALLPLVLEFLMYRQFIDFLFPAQQSHNVLARRKPKGEIKQRIFLVAHADSQYEWTLNLRLGGVGMKLVMIPSVVLLFVSFIANLVKWILLDFTQVSITQGFWYYLFWVVQIAMLCLTPAIIGVLFFQNPFRSVPGANDNLSGCYTAIGVMRELAEAGIDLAHTEVVCMLSGSEEAGLRGAKAYVKKHKSELEEIPTICIGLDTFRDLEHMAVYDRDMSGTVKHDKQVRALMKQAAANCGYDLPYASIYIGACDAAAFTQAGIQSTGFAAMDPTPPRYYHTRLDNWDTLKPEVIAAGVEITLEAVCMYDKEGLPAVQ